MEPKETTRIEKSLSLPEIDPLIHEPARLRIFALLYVVESADFLFLQRQSGFTAGNLSAHLNKLEGAGYIAVIKEFVGKKPHTMLKLTTKGRVAFQEYRAQMRQLFDEIPSERKV